MIARSDPGTIYTGVTQDVVVSYLKLWGDDGASINIAQIPGFAGGETDLTMTFWFKITVDEHGIS